MFKKELFTINGSFFNLQEIAQIRKIVYDRIEIKNGMTKERRGDFAMTLFMKFFICWFELHQMT